MFISGIFLLFLPLVGVFFRSEDLMYSFFRFYFFHLLIFYLLPPPFFLHWPCFLFNCIIASFLLRAHTHIYVFFLLILFVYLYNEDEGQEGF